MIHVYTDVAFQKGKAAAVVLALSDTNFIGYYPFVLDNVPNSTYGELQAILNGLRSIKLKEDESYIVHTDSSSALHFLHNSTIYHKSKECLRVAQEIMQEIQGYSVEFALCVGHMSNHSPNKVVDKASRYILRNLVKEE